MSSFFHLNNIIRDYAWGHKQQIYDFLGVENAENRPAAEVWMGAHPSAPSEILVPGSGRIGLDRWIEKHPAATLGPEISSRFSSLPFLFKLLAAGESLSIQAHPSKSMAEEGYRREEAEGIPRNAPNRNYRDDNHKPEIIMALTSFTAMIGFLPPGVIMSNFKVAGLNETVASDLIASDRGNKDHGKIRDEGNFLKNFLERLLTLNQNARTHLLTAAVAAAGEPGTDWSDSRRYWLTRLATGFPGDIGALAPLFLNIVKLEPGEALYQGAGDLHAYLEGFGVELMANSDNVLRGGLTPKHIDVPELLNVLDFRPTNPEVLHARDTGSGIRRFDSPSAEFSLGLADLKPESPLTLKAGNGPMILLVLEGEAVLSDGLETLELNRGGSAFIPWDARNVEIVGNGQLALAGVGS